MATAIIPLSVNILIYLSFPKVILFNKSIDYNYKNGLSSLNFINSIILATKFGLIKN